jgi:hypothetical protein
MWCSPHIQYISHKRELPFSIYYIFTFKQVLSLSLSGVVLIIFYEAGGDHSPVWYILINGENKVCTENKGKKNTQLLLCMIWQGLLVGSNLAVGFQSACGLLCPTSNVHPWETLGLCIYCTFVQWYLNMLKGRNMPLAARIILPKRALMLK